MNYVIIGNGIAGTTAAESIRQLDPAGAITIISDEPCPPYCRPMISMVLEGAVPLERLSIRSADFYESLKIVPVLGRQVSAIDPESRSVSVNGRKYPYDRLLIASGADPRRIRAEALDLENIFFMRTETHVRGMLAALPDVKQALVLGGGLVGFKAAYGLLRRGVKVTMLIRSAYPLALQVDPETGRMIWDELRAHGLDVRVGVEAVAFEGRNKVAGAHLSDGSHLSCDMVVIGKGVFPAHGFVPKETIAVDAGVLVDAHMQTSVPGVYAAGDVAELTDIARKTPWVNAIWPEAAAQGRIAGLNMAGQGAVYKGSLSRNVIRIFDLDVMTAGLANPAEADACEILSRRDVRNNTYRRLVFRDNRLVGMVLVNRIEQGGVLMSLIQSEIPITVPFEALLQPGFNFSQLLAIR